MRGTVNGNEITELTLPVRLSSSADIRQFDLHVFHAHIRRLLRFITLNTVFC
jgi:hypothetical protein